jgi:hypothetical protein
VTEGRGPGDGDERGTPRLAGVSERSGLPGGVADAHPARLSGGQRQVLAASGHDYTREPPAAVPRPGAAVTAGD